MSSSSFAPDLLQRPRPTQAPGVQHLHLAYRRRLLRGQQPRDRGEDTNRASAARSTFSAHPKLWITFAVGAPLAGCRSLRAS
ncbi:MAG: hypothetical protein ABR616_06370 [Dermatophilaceae bacterium]